MSEETMDWVSQEDSVEYTDSTEEPEEEKETPTDSSTEETTEESNEEETPATDGEQEEETTEPVEEQSEDNLPFHKHPRWKELHEDNKLLKETVNQLNERLSTFNTVPEPTEEAPQWFVNAYGDDPDLYKQYKQAEEQRIADLKQQVIEEIRQEQTSQATQISEYEQKIESDIQALKDKGYDFDENAVKKIVLDNELFDIEGNLNFKAGYEIYKSQRGSKNNLKQEAKKQIASKTSPSGGSAEAPQKEYRTAEDVRGKNWRSLFRQ